MGKTFSGGIHPAARKATAGATIRPAPVPERVIIPLRQHIGAPCEPTVNVGDSVAKGQVIGDTGAFVASPVHASTSGKVVEIGVKPHPVFGACPAVVIEADGADRWLDGLVQKEDWRAMDADTLKKRIRNAGIVGLGGAAFPTHVKLSPPPDKTIDTVILNGAECEPFLTADHRLMVEQPAQIIEGLKVIMRVLNVSRAYIGIETNKPDAIAVMKNMVRDGDGISVVPLACKYPQGAEKTLIKAILGREVPSGGLPMDVGVVVQNVGTALALAEAVTQNKPLIERVVTVAGSCVAEPQNLLVRIGTTFADVIGACGGFSCSPAKVIMGGPMMGIAQAGLDVPVIKGTSGVLALSAADAAVPKQGPCIRCGRCIDACPMGLVPSMFSLLAERGRYREAKEEYDLLDCIECGSCVYVCPAKRNIVHYVKLAKQQTAGMNK